MKITHEVKITLASGDVAVHTAELLSIRHTADGAFTATAACCGKVGDIRTCQSCSGRGCAACAGTGSIKDEDTRSNLATYDIAAKTHEELLAEITDHVQRVASHHASAHKAREFLSSLMMADPAPAAPPVSPADPAPGTVG